MKTSVFLGIIATTLAVTTAIAPAFALSQTVVGGNINTNNQANYQSSAQIAKATTISSNTNDPWSSISQGGKNSFNVGVSSQDATQSSSAATTQTQSNTQNAANFNLSTQSFRLTQTAVCVVYALC